ASHVGADAEVLTRIRRAELELYRPGREDVAREMPHALREIADVILRGVDRPHDVAHRVHELARQVGDRGEGIGERAGTGPETPPDDLAEQRDARQARPDVVVQIGRDALPHALELREAFLAAPAQRVFRAPALRDVARDPGEEAASVTRELAEGNLERHF